MAKRTLHLELSSSMPRLRSLLSNGVSQLLERIRTRVPLPLPLPMAWQGQMERLSGKAQRFAGDAWQKISERWPLLSELVRERRRVSARYHPPAQAQARAATTSMVSTPEVADALIAQLMASSSWETRAGAALSLAHHEGESVVQALLRALRDTSVEVAVAAVDALAHHLDEAATQGLLSVLQNVDGYYSPVTRVAAISALSQRLDVVGNLGVEPVVAAVRDIDAEVSIAAASVVAERIPAACETHLMPVLRDNSGFFLPIVRLAVANAMERAGRLHAGIAAELLGTERDPAVQRVLERASHFTGEIALS